MEEQWGFFLSTLDDINNDKEKDEEWKKKMVIRKIADLYAQKFNSY